MLNSEFEKNMQQKMEGLKFSPSDPVWQKIEAGLPPEKKPRRWLIFIFLFVALSAGSLVLWNQFITTDGRVAKDFAGNNKTDLSNTTKAQSAENTDHTLIKDTAGEAKEEPAKTTDDNSNIKKKLTVAASLKINIKNSTAGNFDNTDQPGRGSKKPKELKTNAAVKMSVNAPAPVSYDDDSFSESPVKKEKREDAGKIKVVITGDTEISSTDDSVSKTLGTGNDSVFVINKDTVEITTLSLNKARKEKKKTAWQYGVNLGSGISTVKNGLFSSSPLYAASNGGFSNGSPNPAQPLPNSPAAGVIFNAGFYLQKNINSKWRFNTGLNYLFQSNKVSVGSRVDSVARVTTNTYYFTGNSVRYRNEFHFLEIPLLFQYKLSHKSKAYVEAGPTIAYLLYSNAIVYNRNSDVYFTGKDIFNRLLLSFNMGAGINLAQRSRLPFSIGYRFQYGVGSVIKNSFGEQHFLNSQLYLKIPLKK